MKQPRHWIKVVPAVMLATAITAFANGPAVPMTSETRVSTNADGIVRAESVERVQLKDGQHADWRTSSTVTRQIKPGCTETTQNIAQAGLQGQPAQTIQRTETREKTAAGETVRTVELTRNAFGKVVDNRVIEETSQREADGSTSIRVVEKAPDRQGNLAFQREEQRQVRTVSPTETTIESRIRSHDRLRGQVDQTAVQTTNIRTEKNTTRIETVTRRTLGDQDRVTGRSVSTETKTGDGSWQRETVEYGLGVYDRLTPLSMGELQAKIKVVERFTQKPDGSSALTREVFRRDLNGEWKPMPFGWAGD